MKRVFSLLLCFALALTLALSAGAEQQSSFLYPLIWSDETVLYLVGAPAGEGSVTVRVNGEAFSNFNVTTASETELGVTYYCMVDQSSSFSLDQRNQQIRGLTALSNSLRPQDSMILVTMGSSLSFGQPLTDPEARQQAIEEACVYTAYSTALYDNIIATVQAAAQAQGSDSLNCVVLFTDGLDNTQREGGKEQVEQAVRDSRLSFNAVSVMTPTNEQFILNNAQQMVLFARESLGGIGTVPAMDKRDSPTNVEDAVTEIVNQVLSSSVIQLEASLLPRDGSLEVAVSWELEGDKRENSVQVDVSLLPPLPEPTEPETTIPETTIPETTEPWTVETAPPETIAPAARSTASGGGNLLLLLALLCFAGVVILIVVAVVLLLREKKQGELPEPEYMEDDSRFIPQSTPVADIKLDFSSLDEPVKKKAAPLTNQAAAVPTCRVRLVPEGHVQGGVEFTIEANTSVTLGRNSKAQIILNETDTALSGLHFELQWDSRALYLRDRNSTNGTALNGTPLRSGSWIRLDNKSVIQAGAMDYTVFVEEK